jgi:cytochrome c oxidase cbb3-type subunit I/II
MQLTFDDQGSLVYKDFMEIVRFNIPFYWVRAAAGALYLVGMLLCLFNILMSMRGARVEDDAVQVPRMLPEPPAPVLLAQVASAPVTPREKATMLHDLVERWPTVLIVLSCILLAVGGVLEIIPSLIQGALTPRIASVTPYSALELTGRDIYIREGCVQCHTQQIRTLRAEAERYGAYHRPGEYIYDRPFLWGSKRTGPDLGRVSRSKPSLSWNYDHLLKPTSVAADSIMPGYPHLGVDDMDLTTLQAKMRALSLPFLPASYTRRDIDQALDDAQAQARGIAARLRTEKQELAQAQGLEKKEVIAVLAYLMRLGTDLERPAGPRVLSTEVR